MADSQNLINKNPNVCAIWKINRQTDLKRGSINDKDQALETKVEIEYAQTLMLELTNRLGDD